MLQPELVLYHYPTACSQVSICALEMAGLDYALRVVDLEKNEQNSPEYLDIQPMGKVPLLQVDGVPLSENPAILAFIAALRPNSGVFPESVSPFKQAEAVSGLVFCSATLHPQVRGLNIPSRFTFGEVEGVREKARFLATRSFNYAERRLAERTWWLGERSIVDVYLNWNFSVARGAGFDVTSYPLLNTLADRLSDLPAFTSMREQERWSWTQLGRDPTWVV